LWQAPTQAPTTKAAEKHVHTAACAHGKEEGSTQAKKSKKGKKGGKVVEGEAGEATEEVVRTGEKASIKFSKKKSEITTTVTSKKSKKRKEYDTVEEAVAEVHSHTLSR
jgi:hypothetical protein